MYYVGHSNVKSPMALELDVHSKYDIVVLFNRTRNLYLIGSDARISDNMSRIYGSYVFQLYTRFIGYLLLVLLARPGTQLGVSLVTKCRYDVATRCNDFNQASRRASTVYISLQHFSWPVCIPLQRNTSTHSTHLVATLSRAPSVRHCNTTASLPFVATLISCPISIAMHIHTLYTFHCNTSCTLPANPLATQDIACVHSQNATTDYQS